MILKALINLPKNTFWWQTMANYICIDSGTTNTRITLLQNGEILETLKYRCGTKGSIDVLKETLKNGINDILTKNNLSECDIKRIIASGMITSELGLVSLPHITAPVGLSELNNSLYEEAFPEISQIPFVFIRGVKVESHDYVNADMMRGEEAEIMGIDNGEGLYILPGSHCKIIKIDNFGRITDFKTTLTGEMLNCLSSDTILKESLGDLSGEIDNEYLFKGLKHAKEQGINQALFKVRVIKNLFGGSNSQVLGFFMGAVLCDEVEYVMSQKAEKIVIGGNKILREPLSVILKKLTNAQVITLTDKEVEKSVTIGQIKIFEYKNKG